MPLPQPVVYYNIKVRINNGSTMNYLEKDFLRKVIAERFKCCIFVI